MRRAAITLVAALAVAASGCAGLGGDDPVAAPADDEGAAAKASAGCELATPGFDGPADHVDPADAPPADELYAERPAYGGQHLGEWLEAGVYDAPIEERAAVHNLEHGAVAVYYDPDLPDAEVADLVEWASARNDAGLLDARTGAGIIVAPWEGPLEPSIAFRAWGVVADCDAFASSFGDGILREHFGSAGSAPEGTLGGDPSRVLGRAADV